MSKQLSTTRYHKKFDLLEARLFSARESGELVESSDKLLDPIFAPGLYIRRCLLPQGTLVTSKIHKHEHAFIVAMGHVKIWSFEYIDGVEIVAPYHGITKKGTRRCVLAYEDSLITTIHLNPDNCTDLTILESRIIQPYENKLITMQLKKAS